MCLGYRGFYTLPSTPPAFCFNSCFLLTFNYHPRHARPLGDKTNQLTFWHLCVNDVRMSTHPTARASKFVDNGGGRRTAKKTINHRHKKATNVKKGEKLVHMRLEVYPESVRRITPGIIAFYDWSVIKNTPALKFSSPGYERWSCPRDNPSLQRRSEDGDEHRCRRMRHRRLQLTPGAIWATHKFAEEKKISTLAFIVLNRQASLPLIQKKSNLFWAQNDNLKPG